MTPEQVRVTRMAADPLNVRQQASRLDIRRQFYSQRVVDAWNKVPTDIKNSVTVSSFKMAYKKHREDLEATTQRVKIGGRMRVDVLLESTIVSERSQWDQRDSTLNSQQSTVNRKRKIRTGVRGLYTACTLF